MGCLLGWAFFFIPCPSSFIFVIFLFIPSPCSCFEVFYNHMASPCIALCSPSRRLGDSNEWLATARLAALKTMAGVKSTFCVPFCSKQTKSMVGGWGDEWISCEVLKSGNGNVRFCSY
jgi:hypothetical protein